MATVSGPSSNPNANPKPNPPERVRTGNGRRAMWASCPWVDGEAVGAQHSPAGCLRANCDGGGLDGVDHRQGVWLAMARQTARRAKGQGAESSVCRGSVLRWLQDGISWCQNQQSITKCCSCDGSRSSKSDPFRRGANDVNAKHRPSLLLRSAAREQPRPLRRQTTPAHACTESVIDTHGVIHWTRPLGDPPRHHC